MSIFGNFEADSKKKILFCHFLYIKGWIPKPPPQGGCATQKCKRYRSRQQNRSGVFELWHIPSGQKNFFFEKIDFVDSECI